ncbi:MAG TPA: ribonuclease Z [Flavipsychrobacter sp.]|nr:ribonuclease Z [Flavipsychrobacter sp.]
MQVTILGNNSALPAFGRHPTAQAVDIGGDVLLLDCGEGTQIQMQQYHVKWRKITHIFISHLHGDHYFGLPGLINSMSLLGRTAPLHLYAPKELANILDLILHVADTKLSYPFHFHPIEDGEATLLADTRNFRVNVFPVEHRIACYGFLITQKTRGRKLLPEKCREYEVPAYFFERLKAGEDYERKDGILVKNEWVTESGPKAKKYAYCADTVYTDSFIEHIAGADLLYHESTYLHDNLEKAAARFHATALQAAELALKANAGRLLLGHYSSKYRDINEFEKEAATIFHNVVASVEGATYEV